MRRKKHVKKGVQFTMMVCGASGTGRTTFVNTLCGRTVLAHEASKSLPDLNSIKHPNNSSSTLGESINVITGQGPKTFDPTKAHIEPGIQINPVTVEMDEEDGTRITLTVVDTPGFGDNIDNEQCFGEILKYLELQYDEILAEESRIKRNPRFKDNRVHVLLYFIEPTGHGLRELDVELMKRLSKRVNVIPVIGRADSMTPAELAATKRMTMEDIEHYNIPIYNFPYDIEEDDAETIEENSQLKSMLPFAIVSSTDIIEHKGKVIRARKYPWGIVDIEDPDFSDFSTLRAAILGSHMADLKDLTDVFLYETYRTEKLSQNIGDPRESALLNPEDLANQSYLLKEEQLQREEEKLREVEMRVQREINEKRMELLAREKELKEMEARIAKERSFVASAEEHEMLQRQIEQQNRELQMQQNSFAQQELQHQQNMANVTAGIANASLGRNSVVSNTSQTQVNNPDAEAAQVEDPYSPESHHPYSANQSATSLPGNPGNAQVPGTPSQSNTHIESPTAPTATHPFSPLAN